MTPSSKKAMLFVIRAITRPVLIRPIFGKALPQTIRKIPIARDDALMYVVIPFVDNKCLVPK